MKHLILIVSLFFISGIVSHASLPQAKEGNPLNAKLKTPDGFNKGELGFDSFSTKDVNTEAYTCWARTECWNGQTISCQATGEKGCRWEVSSGRYVHCEAYDWNGGSSAVTFYCP